MKTLISTLALAFMLSSCSQSFTKNAAGEIAYNGMLGVNAGKVVSTPSATIYEEYNSSESFESAMKAFVQAYGIKGLVDVARSADKLAAHEASTKASAGVANTKTAAGVATNASNNATAIKVVEAKGKAAVGILKNTPIPTP